MKKTKSTIHIEGARVHNLKNISLNIPRNELVVITGLSGSGKSSLAFDTIYAEGQRRYMETFSAYVRQFLNLFLSVTHHFLIGHIAVCSPDTSKKQTNVIVQFCNRTNCGARAFRGRFLFDRNNGRQAINFIDIRTLHIS